MCLIPIKLKYTIKNNQDNLKKILSGICDENYLL